MHASVNRDKDEYPVEYMFDRIEPVGPAMVLREVKKYRTLGSPAMDPWHDLPEGTDVYIMGNANVEVHH